MTSYAALLRAVNIGPHNKVPMSDLRSLLTKLGMKDAQTLLQSGNAVFRTDLVLGGGTPDIDVTWPSGSVTVQAGQVYEDVMMVANVGDSTLRWMANCPDCEDDSGGKPHIWLTLTPDHADVAAGESVPVRVLYDTT